MTNNKHRLVVLTNHIARWLEMPGMSQTTVAMEIVEAFEQLGLAHDLQVEDIFFMRTNDVVADANTNRQKIFRWLGLMDNGAKRSPAKLFFAEQAIVAAMPQAIRLSYLTEVYMGAGVSIYAAEAGAAQPSVETLATSLIREGSEAQLALLSHGGNPAKRHEALRELKESRAAHDNAIATLEALEQQPNIRSVP